ncbi:hypothetical protein ETR_22486 [Erwinia tracheiphila PSU-1]|nr:hypothetical protein ETR_22486 [Erwinia tracheiphila PSU-1]
MHSGRLVKPGGNPQVGGFFTTGRSGPAVAGVVDIPDVGILRVVAGILFHTADAGAAGEHFGDGFDFDIAQTTASRKDAQHGLAVNSFLSGRGLKPESTWQINPRCPGGG